MGRVRRPRVDLDLRPYFRGEERGHSQKELIVLHETVSYNSPGTRDIEGVARFMDATGLEIHGIIDLEQHSAWCYDPTAIYDHAASGRGNVNTRGIGFELVSEIPMQPSKLRFGLWWQRRQQLNKLAKWCAYLHVDCGIPLRYSDGVKPGITTHWDVSQTFLGGHGHWDCWPRHKGGHFPVLYVVRKAQQYLKNGW